MAHRESHDSKAAARAMEAQAAALLVSLKGIDHAHVECDAQCRIARVEIVPAGIDDRAALRNAQSALMAVLGQSIDMNAMAIVSAAKPRAAQELPRVDTVPAAGVLELKMPPVKHGELNTAAKVAFETLRAAQASFHGFQFDGAELVRISDAQYVVVALKRRVGEARFCGAAPVLESVSTASARALMNAVGAAAMGSDAADLDIDLGGEGVRALKA